MKESSIDKLIEAFIINEPGDEDEDGVLDWADECPHTPPGTIVDARGCPVVIPPNYSKSEIDSDNDGIPDKYDQCPFTPPGTLVDAHGCPIPEVN